MSFDDDLAHQIRAGLGGARLHLEVDDIIALAATRRARRLRRMRLAAAAVVVVIAAVLGSLVLMDAHSEVTAAVSPAVVDRRVLDDAGTAELDDTLDGLARAALASSSPLGQGYRYVARENYGLAIVVGEAGNADNGDSFNFQELWVDADGFGQMVPWLHELQPLDIAGPPSRPTVSIDTLPEVQPQVESPVVLPYHVTVPTDPALVAAHFARTTSRPGITDHELFDEAVVAMIAGPLTGEQRAALWQFIGTLDGVGVVPDVTDRLGRTGPAVVLTHDDEQLGAPVTMVVIADPATGEVVSYEQILRQATPVLDVPTPATLTYQLVHRTGHVAAVGDRPSA